MIEFIAICLGLILLALQFIIFIPLAIGFIVVSTLLDIKDHIKQSLRFK